MRWKLSTQDSVCSGSLDRHPLDTIVGMIWYPEFLSLLHAWYIFRNITETYALLRLENAVCTFPSSDDRQVLTHGMHDSEQLSAVWNRWNQSTRSVSRLKVLTGEMNHVNTQSQLEEPAYGHQATIIITAHTTLGPNLLWQIVPI